jgi:hypothetical protein
MSNNLIIIKVLSKSDGTTPSSEDLKKWQKIFEEGNKSALEEGVACGEITMETLLTDEDEEYPDCCIVDVKIT